MTGHAADLETVAALLRGEHSAFTSLVGAHQPAFSFLATTPGIWDPSNPFGGFIMKDIILLGVALHSSSEALRARASVPALAHR